LRKINFDEFMEEKKRKFSTVKAILGRRKLPRRKKRDCEERELLMIMDRNRFRRWLREGKLKMLSLRHFLLEL